MSADERAGKTKINLFSFFNFKPKKKTIIADGHVM